MRHLYLLCVAAVGTALGLSLLRAIRRYLCGAWGVCNSKKLMRGKTVVITGSNTGIGKATALELAKRRAKVVMGCRSMEKGKKAASEIMRISGNKEVACFHLDLASLASVRRFAEVVLASYTQIDVLINNAGIMACPYCKTEDGFEMQFGVNHLGHFLLTNLLLDHMCEVPGARIVNVSSSTYKWVKGIDFSDINSEQVYQPMKAYSQSKLANILFTNVLARRLEGTGTTVNSLHPGIVRTELGRFRLQDTNSLFKVHP